MWPVGRARFVVISLVSALLAGAPATAVAPEGASVGDQVTSFHFQPPSAFTGDLTLRFAFDWGQDNPCRVLFGMSGVPSEAPLWGIVASDNGNTYAMYYDYALRAHGDGVVVHPAVVLGENDWGFGIFEGVPRSGEEAFTLAGTGLARWVAPEGGVFENLFFQVDCDRPFTVVAIAGGQTMHAFTELGGDGIGAGAYSPFVETQVAVADGVTSTMTEPLVGVVLRAAGSTDARNVGRYTVETPMGATAWTTADPVALDEEGGPGEYVLEATHMAAGVSTTLFGALVGLHPVQTLDDLDRWTT